MLKPNASDASMVWRARFFEHVDPGDRIGELLFGLIMVLTFTLGAGIQLGSDSNASRELLIAALGCNAAWGIIDAALHLIGRMSERGRINRLLRSIQAAPHEADAIELIDQELADRLPPIVRRELRAALNRDLLDQFRLLTIPRNHFTAADLWGRAHGLQPGLLHGAAGRGALLRSG
jgi:hypothetical protein